MLWLGLAASSQAANIETAYTLDSAVGPISYGGGTNTATLDPISPTPTPDALDSICLDGICDIENQDWVIFRASVLTGNLGVLGLTLQDTFTSGLNALGMGYFLEGGPVQDGSGSTATYSGTLADPDQPIFNFLANGGGNGITGTTLILFVAYADGSLPQTPTDLGILGDGAVSFMAEEFGGGGAGSQQGNFATPIDVVPEPGTGLLLGLGVLLLGARSRR